MSEGTTEQSISTKDESHDTKESLVSRITAWWHRKDKNSVSQQFEQAVIGDPEKGVVRVIAFSAGGADSVFEFGMVHAFLVSDAPKPHIVAGTSSGAVVAAMLADVLQAGESEESGSSARRLAQVARFRSLLEQTQQLPADFKEASWPDFTEVSARAGLAPLNLPTQQPLEKDDRHATALARFGLTRLLNGMLSSRLKIRELTRIIRLAMELQALREFGSRFQAPAMLCLATWTTFCIWLQSMVPLIRDAPLVLRSVLAPAREWVIRKPFLRRLLEAVGFRRLRDAKTILFEPWYVLLGRVSLFLLSYPLVALAWFFAPPALAVWLFLNRLARRVRIGKRRDLVLRFSGLFILFTAALFVARKYQTILAVYSELAVIFSRLGTQNYLAAFSDWQQFRHGAFRALCFVLAWVAPGVVFAALAMALGATSNKGELLALFLDGFGIKKDLLTTGVLNRLLMRAFDPFFFGKRRFSQALNEALGGKPQKTHHRNYSSPEVVRAQYSPAASETNPDQEGPGTLADWIWMKSKKVRVTKKHPILVAPVAADIATGKLLILEPATPIVEALGAACALTPLFAAMQIKATPDMPGDPLERWLVDASCVAREPIQPVLDLIKSLNINRLFPGSTNDPLRSFVNIRLVDDPSLIDLCVISPYPTRRLREQERRQMAKDMTTKAPSGPPDTKPTTNWEVPGTLYRLSEIFSLRATHSAKDERILVTLYNAVLKQHQEATGKALFCSSLKEEQAKNIEDWHVSANLRELEPEKSIHLTTNLIRCADDSKKRALLLRTIADGCRASLTGLYRNKFAFLADQFEEEEVAMEPASKTVNRKCDSDPWSIPPCRKLQDSLNSAALPGILDEKSPPGITEICRECRFYSDPRASWAEIIREKRKPAQSASPPVPDWGEMLVKDAPPPNIKTYLPEALPSDSWPRDRNLGIGEEIQKGKERPLVSIIFSGGVFRGVFQVGVLNAFCMAGITPDVVAGASVGTIMAALSARVFTEPDPDRRKHRLTSVAATFLAIDRLVLTDRFADFIRRFTLRAGSVDFSLRDADHLFRQFDRRNWELLARRSRRVLAGIHRLSSVDPFGLLDLLRLNLPHRRGGLADRIVLFLQDAINRAGIGSELLGAEPLDQLIKAHVLSKSEDRAAGFNEFLNDGGIHFMATTTNLTTGELDVLASFCNELRRPALVPGLLASSAFPAVFRPRMNWELRAGSPGLPEELIDGGIADNLPIIPVYRFLFYAGQTNWLKLRPTVDSKVPDKNRHDPRPHLLLTASLEPRKQILKGENLKRTAECWPSLKTRVNQLQYNVKVDSHRRTQSDLRKIHEALQRKQLLTNQSLTPTLELPDLHVSCVKPEWLCGTFAFHPMLGFRRKRQAQSIAHGCASALVHLYCEQGDHKDWTESWWQPLQLRPDVWTRDEGPEISFKLQPKHADAEGNCCFVQGRKCPFSKPELERVAAVIHTKKGCNENAEPLDALGRETVEALHRIYQECGSRKTHRRPEE